MLERWNRAGSRPPSHLRVEKGNRLKSLATHDAKAERMRETHRTLVWMLSRGLARPRSGEPARVN